MSPITPLSRYAGNDGEYDHYADDDEDDFLLLLLMKTMIMIMLMAMILTMVLMIDGCVRLMNIMMMIISECRSVVCSRLSHSLMLRAQI